LTRVERPTLRQGAGRQPQASFLLAELARMEASKLADSGGGCTLYLYLRDISGG